MAPATKAGYLLDQLANHYGSLHWRPSKRPVDELVSTILSQNTSDTNSARAFASLRRRFPTWNDVREAQTEAVADAIRSGGLAEQKAPRIQHALAQILDSENPDTNVALQHRLETLELESALGELTPLPGIGPKTAACVLLFAVGLPAIPVDTHVHRVSKRIGLISAKTNADKAHIELARIVPADRAYDFHVYLIRHGREVCKARSPRCEACVLADICLFRQTNMNAERDTQP
jgi:endonuclease III